MRPLRILTIAACPMPAQRGTPVRIARMSEALAARGHEVVIATYHIGDSADAGTLDLVRINRPFRLGTLPPGPTPGKLLRFDPALLRTVRRLVAERRFDVIHAHHFEGLIVGALARPKGVPLVYDAHTMLRSELPSYVIRPLRPLAGWLARPLDAFLPRLADHVVCAGRGTRDALVAQLGLASDCVSHAGNGVEIEHFSEAFAARAAQPRGAAPQRILYTGTLAAYQDIDLLFEAFAQLRETHPDVRLVLASPSVQGPLAAQADALGIADRLDLAADDFASLPRLLQGAALTVLPRLHCDGVPQKLLNYMAAGCPIVASQGSAALLEHEVTGLVVANGDVQGFAAAMRRLLDRPDEATALGAQAHDVIAQGMSWDATARQVEQIYGQLLGEPAEISSVPAGKKAVVV